MHRVEVSIGVLGSQEYGRVIKISDRIRLYLVDKGLVQKGDKIKVQYCTNFDTMNYEIKYKKTNDR